MDRPEAADPACDTFPLPELSCVWLFFPTTIWKLLSRRQRTDLHLEHST